MKYMAGVGLMAWLEKGRNGREGDGDGDKDREKKALKMVGRDA